MPTIMIIDDKMNVEKIKQFLQQENIQIITAENNRQALETIDRTYDTPIDLILINTRLPGRKNSTALFSLHPAQKKGFDNLKNYLQKPFTKDQCIEFVKNKIQHE